MRSMTFSHGHSVLWAETDEKGRVLIQSEGPLSAVARAGLVEDALHDLAQQTRTPARVLRALMIQESTPRPRRLLAGILAIIFSRRGGQ
jgi:hypothetical protein